MTHHLTEAECNTLRAQLSSLAEHSSTESFITVMKAIRLLDEARSKSFKARLAKRDRTPALTATS